MRKLTTKYTTSEWIEAANKKHNNKYDYSKVVYESRKKVIIICPEHGEFKQRVDTHLEGRGCPKCAKRHQYTTKEWIEAARKVHGNFYDYSKVNYINSRTRIIIICPNHGEFEQTPKAHLEGLTCIKCARKYNYTTEEWIEEAKKRHGNFYDYSKVNYKTNILQVIIICPIHGEFEQRASMHLFGHGCPKCGGSYQYTTEEWIPVAQKIHGNTYDYSQVKYISCKTKIIVICKEHGPFQQTPNSHLNGKGCPVCNSSKGEKIINELFLNNTISIEREYSYFDLTGNNNGPLRFDFAVFKNEKILFLLEYQGSQHFIPWSALQEHKQAHEITKLHDQLKQEYCETRNIPLEFINYDQDIEERFNYLLEKYKLAL